MKGKTMKHHNLRTSIWRIVVCFAALLLLDGTDRCMGDSWKGSDDFSLGIVSTNWTVVQSAVGAMTAQGTNGHVSFLVPVSSANEQNAYLLWRGTPTAAEDWMVEITGHNSAPYSTNGGSYLQFAVVRTGSIDTSLEGYRLAMGAHTSDPCKLFGAAQWINETTIDRAKRCTTTTDFSLRLIYRSAGRQIESWYYDPTQPASAWTWLDTISLAEFSPSWTASDTFTFAILANTYYGPISDGQIWADNFASTILPPPLVVQGAESLAGSVSLHLTWTNIGCECVLQHAGSVTGSWSTVSTPWGTNAGWVSTTVANSSPAQFYRLRAN